MSYNTGINTGMTDYNSGLRRLGGNGRPVAEDGIPPGARALASALLAYFVYPRNIRPIEHGYGEPLDFGNIAVKGIIACRKRVKPPVNMVPVEPVAVGASTTEGLIPQPELPKNKLHRKKLGMAELQERLRIAIEPEQ